MDTQLKIVTQNAQETMLLGEHLGECITSGDCIAFFGGLGSGKTTMIKGIARGAGVPPATPVSSPSFVIIREYAGRVTLYHLDFYRMGDMGEILSLDWGEYLYGDSAALIEWAQRGEDVLPEEYLSVSLEFRDQDVRIITLVALGERYEKYIKKVAGR